MNVYKPRGSWKIGNQFACCEVYVSEWVCMRAARLGAVRCSRLNVKTFDIAAEIPSIVRIRK